MTRESVIPPSDDVSLKHSLPRPGEGVFLGKGRKGKKDKGEKAEKFFHFLTSFPEAW
jgi:hypothetical protein